MDLNQFKLLNQAERDAYGENIPLGITYDEKGNLLTYKDKNGSWYEYTRDDKGNELTSKHSDGTWRESTYDKHGYELTFKDSDGDDCVFLHHGIDFTLYYNHKNSMYEAGCQCLTYDECLEFYDENKTDFDDADIFIEKIKEHHLTLENKSV